jgi:hypothetical protein
MRNSKTVFLYGGLGNQLFQLNFASTLVCDHVTIDTSFVDLKSLDYVKSITNYFDYFTEKRNYNYWKKQTLRLLAKSNIILNTDKNPHAESNYYFGYWQNCDYLETDRTYRYFNENWLNSITSTRDESYIAIHVRKGDYTTKKNRLIYVQLDTEYYVKALESLENHSLKSKIVRIISEEAPDKDLVHAVEALGYQVCHQNNKFTVDFEEMISAEALIAANSTFSIWAGILSRNHFVRPQKWFTSDSRIHLKHLGTLI